MFLGRHSTHILFIRAKICTRRWPLERDKNQWKYPYFGHLLIRRTSNLRHTISTSYITSGTINLPNWLEERNVDMVRGVKVGVVVAQSAPIMEPRMKNQNSFYIKHLSQNLPISIKYAWTSQDAVHRTSWTPWERNEKIFLLLQQLFRFGDSYPNKTR